MAGPAPPEGALPLRVQGRRALAMQLRRAALWIFIGAIALLLAGQARSIDWQAVLASMRRIAPPMLGAAALFAAGSHLSYSTYDLLGRRLTGHRLGTPTVMAVTFVSYAFNLNLGTLIGGIAFRYRLYSKLGLPGHTITQVLGFSLLTNWFGYVLLAGALFSGWPMPLPAGWRLDAGGLQALGVVLLTAGAAYLVLCAVSGRRRWTVRGRVLETPSLTMALLQLSISVATWSLDGAVIWCLLQGQWPYAQVLSVFLVAAVAGVIAQLPGGLGVLEAVFLALLGDHLPRENLLGALLAYRAIYYLIPLAIAAPAYLAFELKRRRSRGGEAASG
jgi:glycosyltransferase 2 family protein